MIDIQQIKTQRKLSEFYDISVYVDYVKGEKPFVMAVYKDFAAKFLIEDMMVIEGAVPNRQLKLVLAWLSLHEDEVMENWLLAKENKPVEPIRPLV